MTYLLYISTEAFSPREGWGEVPRNGRPAPARITRVNRRHRVEGLVLHKPQLKLTKCD